MLKAKPLLTTAMQSRDIEKVTWHDPSRTAKNDRCYPMSNKLIQNTCSLVCGTLQVEMALSASNKVGFKIYEHLQCEKIRYGDAGRGVKSW